MKRKTLNFNKKIVTTKTPLRISFLGGGTDMPYFFDKYRGMTISSTIDKFIYVTVKIHTNFKEKYRLNYSETEITNDIEKIRNLRIKETLKFFKVKEPLYINTISDLPYNTGLGSSSAFLIGLIQAIYKLKGENISLSKICEIAFKIENKITNNSLGKQDHYIAAFGGFRKIIYKKNEVKVKKVFISKQNKEFLNNNLLFFWTGISRLSNKNLTQQKKNFHLNLENLIFLTKLTKKLNSILCEKNLDLNKAGKLLDQNWKLKKSFSDNISNKHLDKIYNKAILAGCIGGKLLGAGGGGFFLFICEKHKQSKVTKILKNCKRINFRLEEKGSEVCFLN